MNDFEQTELTATEMLAEIERGGVIQIDISHCRLFFQELNAKSLVIDCWMRRENGLVTLAKERQP